jgi:membrane-associated phospholipid phosphatase
VLLVTIIVIVFSRRKGRAYCLLLFILLNTYLTGILKAIHCDPRPFWSDNLVRSIGFYCPQEYGNPSGHSWFITVLCFAFVIDFYGVGKKYLHLVVSLALLVLVPMSRMYLGAHSLNQVLEGLTLGLAINIIYVLVLKKHICNFY